MGGRASYVLYPLLRSGRRASWGCDCGAMCTCARCRSRALSLDRVAGGGAGPATIGRSSDCHPVGMRQVVVGKTEEPAAASDLFLGTGPQPAIFDPPFPSRLTWSVLGWALDRPLLGQARLTWSVLGGLSVYTFSSNFLVAGPLLKGRSFFQHGKAKPLCICCSG